VGNTNAAAAAAAAAADAANNNNNNNNNNNIMGRVLQETAVSRRSSVDSINVL
jgi:hypothetical protein